MKKKEKDEQFAAHLPAVLSYHQNMLADGVRNKFLYQAIKANVTSDTSFLDVGAGTGVWAILAAKLGAKRVVAVEIEECLIPVIYKHAQENGVAHKIEIIHANSNDVKLRGRFDVIVSELFGNDAIGAETVRSFVNIRNRFLAQDGVLIPQKLAMMSGPAHYARSVNDLPADLPLSTRYIKALRLNYGRHLPLAERDDVKFMAEPKKLLEIDFRTIEQAPLLENLSLSWNVKQLRKANAIVSYNKSTFTDEIDMDSFSSQSWGASVNEFVPFELKSGELKYSVTIDPQRGNWSVSLPSHPDIPPQNYGPVFAFGRVRTAQQMTPHRKINPPKKKKS
ncbi:MAG: 50S ribosomal protein L11 methyltransferase [Acidobacteriota bacterium]